MPSPVEALPWGSRSTISTRSPMAARAVPRLIAVVVLPTPPFWLASASTRGAFTFPVFGSILRSDMAEPSCVGTIEVSLSIMARSVRWPKAPLFFGETVNDENLAAAGLAWGHFVLNRPIFRGFGQFGPYI